MFCNACGKQIPDDANLCSYCGRPVAAAVPVSAPLVRPRQGRRIAGVCLGLARHFGWNVTWLRILWVVLLLFAGTGLLAYVILWIVIPNEA
jgi:phage shock protein C